MHILIALVLTALMLVPTPSHAAGEDDEAWIEKYMASASAPGLTRDSRQARTVEFGQLSKHVGQRVRFTLDDGRERRGIVEGTAAGEVQVRAQFNGGFFLYSLSRSDIRNIQLD